MAQAVSRRPPIAEARVRSRVSPCRICGGHSGTERGFSPSSSVFPCQFYSSGVPLLGIGQKIIIFIFIIGLHNKPHGCSASVASAAGPCTAKRNLSTDRHSKQIAKIKAKCGVSGFNLSSAAVAPENRPPEPQSTFKYLWPFSIASVTVLKCLH
jgi:hypothetical protein